MGESEFGLVRAGRGEGDFDAPDRDRHPSAEFEELQADAAAGLREIFELAEADRLALIEEIAVVTRAVSQAFRADKLNIAALGNIVPQLHEHVIARFRSDPAWPAPVWGRTKACPYTDAASADVLRRIKKRRGATLSPAG